MMARLGDLALADVLAPPALDDQVSDLVTAGLTVDATIARYLALEAELLARLGALMGTPDEPTPEFLWDVYSRVRLVRQPGWQARWSSAGLTPANTLREQIRNAERHAPNAGQAWIGPWPLSLWHPAPRKGVCVVYYLLDGDRHVYTGSTQDLRVRLKAHARDGKRFTSWQTSPPHRSRAEAYNAEAAELDAYLPPLNRRWEPRRTET